MEIIQITDKVRKSIITRNILESLETWFGIEDSREQYILESKEKVFFCAFDNEQPVGFVYLCLHKGCLSVLKPAPDMSVHR